ncbi:MAG: hypothetical protein NZ853_08715 [Leptospiraceae bacterium]|nr:hypothetical protein [Leptospiraceae bacterium]MDW7976743.1 hypothetical protein [Leptospiraceae bacterium]
MENNIQIIIENIKKSGKYGDTPVFSKSQIEDWEYDLNFQFPEDFKTLVTTLEPEIVNFYFVKPQRHSKKNHYIVFAEWTDDLFAFNEKDLSVVTLLNDNDSGKTWKNFTEWMEYVWNMSNKPINPE